MKLLLTSLVAILVVPTLNRYDHLALAYTFPSSLKQFPRNLLQYSSDDEIRVISSGHDEYHESSSRNRVPCPTVGSSEITRRASIRAFVAGTLTALLGADSTHSLANAAPPMAVIAEELGYFPVTNKNGETTYIPARIKQKSTEQAIELSNYLRASGAVMYGAFWCPHCQRQRAMFGREAWANINYVECAKNGAGSDLKMCEKKGITGFPTWKFKNGKEASGEMPLERLAQVAGYKNKFDGALEPDLPAGGGSCQ